jgi:hypothetical protein
MKQEELFDLADKAGVGFVRYSGEKNIEKMETLAALTRNQVLEEVAKEFDKMPFGDTSASFAIFVRNMKT